MNALDLLLTRQSMHALQAPGPDAAQLDVILRAALRVPDFQNLKPFEFVVAEGEGREKLGALMQQAARASGRAEEDIARAPKMPLRAPLVIVVIARAKASKLVPLFDQRLAAGCAVMAMQMAAFAQGFAGVWRSGWPMHDDNLPALLGLGADDRIVGFLYLGSATKPYPPLPTVDPAAFTRRL
ncbi:NAD(P)H nitroreductase [Rhodoblastus sphagnicola]|uniref:Putative NAD(P)H nitroreductase n=1 Tax=Rhodoblastus sphagnicola TaxID=333368 RepID=A0A2S6N8F2_9HYPH|nr:NAD(P)H nitroreductase [Rhodoblastus sphagnicola]MBB4198148.1 nitroreductase [Rhodoblastus sphagnicola]PPQ30890.1 NAD(P)H nitroreductase [Rhodoblastus sphagnicola]